MLHHEESPEKPKDIMTAPISRQPPHFTLSPIFWHEVSNPLHFHQFWKSWPPPFYEIAWGEEGSNHNQDFVKTLAKLLPFLYKII